MADPRDETPVSREQIQDAFLGLLGYHAREADVQVIQAIGGTRASLADAIWDHRMGEPETPTLEEVLQDMHHVWDGS